MGQFWVKLGRVINSFYIWFIYLSVAAVTLITALQVSLRFIPGAKLYGTAELITLSAAWMYFLGMGYVSYRNKHITADVLSWLLPEDSLAAKWLGLLGAFLGVLVCAFYGFLAFQHMEMVGSMHQQSTDLGYPRIILVSSVGVGFLLMLIFSIYHFVREIIALRRFQQGRAH